MHKSFSGSGSTLPALIVPRETIRYVARPGLRALPSGTLAIAGFAMPQVFSAYFILWAVWWPAPRTPGGWAFASSVSAVMAGLFGLVLWLLLRKFPGFALGVCRAPFIRLTVTDQRVLWTLPWHAAPLLEIGTERVVGGLLGYVDKRGVGSAAIILVPGDPAADVDGNIHFDRLPDAAGFVAALGER
jgi:hypothetical protein